jgi:hypothetical protein
LSKSSTWLDAWRQLLLSNCTACGFCPAWNKVTTAAACWWKYAARAVEPAAQVAAVVLADAFGPHHLVAHAIDHVLQLQAPALMAGDGLIDVDLGHEHGGVLGVQHQFAAVVFHGPGRVGAARVLLPHLEQSAEKTHVRPRVGMRAGPRARDAATHLKHFV